MRLFIASALLCFASTVAAQQPQTVHAQVSTQAVDHGLAAQIQQLEKGASATMWVGYRVPTTEVYKSGWHDEKVTHLEGPGYSSMSSGDKVEGDKHANILMRLAGGRIDKVRAEATDQTIDAGDLRLVWLTNVTPEESVAELKSLALETGTRPRLDTALFLMAIHDSPAVMPALTSLAGAGNDLAVREKAAFWLANQRGHEGFLAVQQLARTDKDDRFREKLTFDLTLTKDAGGLDELIRMAHEDAAPRVRQQAQFWMAQSAKKRDAGRISDELRRAAEGDPDVQTRRQAVFAVSQLPREEAVPRLTELASNSTHPEVREQAVFWLGQSKDPRALEYLTKLLK